MATAQPAYSSTEPATPTTSSATTTAETSATYTAVGPSTLASRCRSQVCGGIPSPSRQCAQEIALAYPATRKNTGTACSGQVSHCVHGMSTRGFCRPKEPS